MNPGGEIETYFIWGFDISSNNEEEVYSLLQGLRIAIDSSIQLLIVVGYAMVIIIQMVVSTTLVDNLLALVIARVKQEAIKFTSIKFYHVLWENNHLEYGFSNQATTLKVGFININGIVSNRPIP